MILVDDRSGSKELADPLKKLGLDVELTRLDYGDVAFEGKGAGGKGVTIGVEFKQLEEFVTSTRTERIQGYQMLGMRDSYDYNYLLIEGEIFCDSKGLLQRRRRHTQHRPLHGTMTANEFYKRIYTLHLCGGLNPILTTNRSNSLQALLALYRTWTDKALDQHKSHLAIYEAPTLMPISDKRRTFKTFPGVGLRASLAVERHFHGSIHAAVNASTSEWASIEIPDDKGKTRRLGLKAAERIVAHCRG